MIKQLITQFIAKFRPTRPSIIGSCTHCGECCRNIIIHDGDKVIRSKEDFASLIAKNDYYRMFKISGQEPYRLYFTCSNLDENNLCKIHPQRPQICRDYPSERMLMMGASLPKDCGYQLAPHMKFDNILEKRLQELENDK